ncbi:MAG: hypothetical protein H8E68_03070 [Kiritimatiellaeota bacterium]|nr:hypothetical protein [Kiritimatiellota bacterium]
MKTEPIKQKLFVILAALSALPCFSAIIIGSPTTSWIPITYGANVPDPVEDQQTGLVSGDLVGDTNHPAFYSQFDDAGTPSLTDGTLAFRVRLNSIKNESKRDFDYNLFIGIDADQNGSLDLFLGVDNNPNGSGQLAIWDPGPGLNDGPSSTTIVSPPLMTFAEAAGTNYHFALVDSILDPSATSYDLDGAGKTDAFISFSFDFGFIVNLLSASSISIDQTSGMNYVMATATQDNSLNMDINGIDGGIDSALTFEELGASSDALSATGHSVPEPAVMTLIGIGGLSLMISKHLRSNRIYG